MTAFVALESEILRIVEAVSRNFMPLGLASEPAPA